MDTSRISKEFKLVPYPEGSVVKILVEDRKSPMRKEEFVHITDTYVGGDGSCSYTVEPQDPERFACWAYQHSEIELYQPAYVVPPMPPPLEAKHAKKAHEK